eukprot:73979-Pyramimonas_sp.AAC.1
MSSSRPWPPTPRASCKKPTPARARPSQGQDTTGQGPDALGHRARLDPNGQGRAPEAVQVPDTMGALRARLLRLRGPHPIPRAEQGRGAAPRAASQPYARGPADRARRAQGRHGRGAVELPHRARPRHREQPGERAPRGHPELARGRAARAR